MLKLPFYFVGDGDSLRKWLLWNYNDKVYAHIYYTPTIAIHQCEQWRSHTGPARARARATSFWGPGNNYLTVLVATKSTQEAQKFQNFLGEQPPDPPSGFCISVLQAAESWAWPGYETRKRSVPTLCPGIGCALPTPLSVNTFSL